MVILVATPRMTVTDLDSPQFSAVHHAVVVQSNDCTRKVYSVIVQNYTYKSIGTYEYTQIQVHTNLHNPHLSSLCDNMQQPCTYPSSLV